MNVLIIILLLLPNYFFASERIYVGDISKHPFTLSPHTGVYPKSWTPS